MKKVILIQLFFAVALQYTQPVVAQQQEYSAQKTLKVGVFAPLYLDSVFSASGNFRYRETMPRFIVPAVDFINGVMAGIDSLGAVKDNVEVHVFDTRSYSNPLPALIRSGKLNELNLLIGAVKDIDYKYLADLAVSRQVPFISASYPNDGGVTANPYVVIMNTTLKSHCEGIYSYLLQNHGTDKIFLCRRTGQQEDRVAGYFKAINEQDGRALLNIQTLNIDSNLTSSFLKSKLDSNRHTVMIGGSLDEGFANSLTKACYQLYQKYPLTLIGMPNWDGFKSLVKKEAYTDFPIIFTTPYFNTKQDAHSRMLMEYYSQKLKGRPSDMSFKGFECAQMFIRLLIDHPTDFMEHLNDKNYRVYSEYNFKPVRLRKESYKPDYIENKHLYFVRILNGSMYKAW
ncbi:MAG TPA: hypothetical protein PKC39_12990 [Ferruginibacter sp.]|nr:hypothetical protein [Ferruginibacter sp.]HMP21868.1 hypothetical protein [Ferruginibacter sp.]